MLCQFTLVYTNPALSLRAQVFAPSPGSHLEELEKKLGAIQMRPDGSGPAVPKQREMAMKGQTT